MGDGVIVNEQNVVIHKLGILDWDIYDCISSNHVTDEVIITEEQMMHIRERHPEAYIDAMHKLVKRLFEVVNFVATTHPMG